MKKKDKLYEDNRYRNFMVLFYDESKHYNFDDVLFNLHGFKYYAYIKHQPESDEKTSHYHAFLKVDSATTESAIASKLGIPVDKVQYVKNIRAANRYLIHIDYPEKIQYSIDDVRVSGLWKRHFMKCFEDVKTEEEIIQDIYFFIDNNHYDSYVEKLKYLITFINSIIAININKHYQIL